MYFKPNLHCFVCRVQNEDESNLHLPSSSKQCKFDIRFNEEEYQKQKKIRIIRIVELFQSVKRCYTQTNKINFKITYRNKIIYVFYCVYNTIRYDSRRNFQQVTFFLCVRFCRTNFPSLLNRIRQSHEAGRISPVSLRNAGMLQMFVSSATRPDPPSRFSMSSISRSYSTNLGNDLPIVELYALSGRPTDRGMD